MDLEDFRLRAPNFSPLLRILPWVFGSPGGKLFFCAFLHGFLGPGDPKIFFAPPVVSAFAHFCMEFWVPGWKFFFRRSLVESQKPTRPQF